MVLNASSFLCKRTASSYSIWHPKGIRKANLLHGNTFSTTFSSASLLRPLPDGTIDSHMHVIEPERFPLSASAQYKPKPHTLEDAYAFYKPLGIKKMVFVQVSPYGNDNACLIDALRQAGPENGRGVVQFDPTTIKRTTLEDWHEAGVRGVRVNLVSVGRSVAFEELKRELVAYAKVIAPLDWVLDLYVPLALTQELEKIVPELGVKVCIDHFASPPLSDPEQGSLSSMQGFKSLFNLLKGGQTWLKFSAPYRISKDPEYRDLEPLAKLLLRDASDRVVYATDWPHTRFEHIDTAHFVNKCFQWTNSDESVTKKLFRTNAEELWDIKS